MHQQTHFAISWALGHRLPERRDRVLIAWSGLLPDIDGLTILLGRDVYARWHHVLAHSLLAAVVAAALLAIVAKQRLKVAIGVFVVMHVHLLCDLVGSGLHWPISYLYPFSDWQLYTPFGWELASWPNVAITVAVIGFCLWVGLRRGYTVVEAFLPKRADQAVVRTLRARFGNTAKPNPTNRLG